MRTLTNLIALSEEASIDMIAPKGVIKELRRGLAWHKEGESGDGLMPETVSWAKRLAAGEPIDMDKAVKMRAWFDRHEVDKQGKGYNPGEEGYPSPGRVAWALWGGDAGEVWSNKLVKQLEAKDINEAQTFQQMYWKGQKARIEYYIPSGGDFMSVNVTRVDFLLD